MSELADLLLKRRTELGWSQNEAAQRIGVSNGYICALETDRNPGTGKPSRPSSDILRRIANGYGLDYYELMALAGHMTREEAEAMKLLNQPGNRHLRAMVASDPETLKAMLKIIARHDRKPEH